MGATLGEGVCGLLRKIFVPERGGGDRRQEAGRGEEVTGGRRQEETA